MKRKKISFLSKIFSKILLCVILLLIALICLKASPNLREKLYKNVFQKHFSFAKINTVYEKLFGSSLPLTSNYNVSMVSS